MKPVAWAWALAACLAVTAPAAAQQAPLQLTPPRVTIAEGKKIWDVPFGTPAADIPRGDFAEPACGTNGGPRARLLRSFADFAACRRDTSTGLFEINFIYDDEREYLARATRDASLIQAWTANQILGQPVQFSFLIDDSGLVQGYRVFTDDRAGEDTRQNAYILGQIYFKNQFGEDGWTCVTAEPAPGEKPVSGRFINDTCRKEADGRRMVVTSRFYYRPGQQLMDPRTNTLMVGQYISTSSIEVVNLASITPN